MAFASAEPTSDAYIFTIAPGVYLVELAANGVTSLTMGGSDHILVHDITGVYAPEECG